MIFFNHEFLFFSVYEARALGNEVENISLCCLLALASLFAVVIECMNVAVC